MNNIIILNQIKSKKFYAFEEMIFKFFRPIFSAREVGKRKMYISL